MKLLPEDAKVKNVRKKLIVKAELFHDGEEMPSHYSSDGEGVSPAIRWSSGPTGTQSFLILVRDPDVSKEITITHWLLYNITSHIHFLPEGFGNQKYPPFGTHGLSGFTDDKGNRQFGHLGWLPCEPPEGDKRHRYIFRVYALNKLLVFKKNEITESEVFKEIKKENILAYGETYGTYIRKKNTPIISSDPLKWSTPKTRKKYLSLLIPGDINIQKRTSKNSPWKHVINTLHDSDVLFANFESPLVKKKRSKIEDDVLHKMGWEHSNPKMIEFLKEAGFKTVGCANNVTFPRSVIQSHVRHLKSAKINFTGCGANENEAYHHAIQTSKSGLKIGFLAFTTQFFPGQAEPKSNLPGVLTIRVETSYRPGGTIWERPGGTPGIVTHTFPSELEELRSRIKDLSKDVDFIVVMMHWGYAFDNHVHTYQKEIAYAAIDAGAGLVAGCSAHVVQGIEVYKETPIFYGLSNFVFDWWKMERYRDGLLARVCISPTTKKVIYAQFLPITISSIQERGPRMLNTRKGRGATIIGLVRNLSLELNHGNNIFIPSLSGNDLVLKLKPSKKKRERELNLVSEEEEAH